MKAQFKYAFLAGLAVRGAVFAVIFIMDAVFIALGSLGPLPFAAHVVAVSLGGVAIAAMLAANIGGDVAIVRRMFSAPEAYLHALTPVPRWKTLLAGIVTMAAMDVGTMTVVITGETWLSLNLAGGNLWQFFWNALREYGSYMGYILWFIVMLFAGYFLTVMIIIFSLTAKKSVFFKMPVSGFLSFLLACVCFYAVSLLQLVLIPISEVQRYGLLFIITPRSGAALPLLLILTLLEAVVLFVFTSKLMERKINI